MSDMRSALGSDDLVTGEAVALDLPPATVALRLGSGLIDLVAAGLLLSAVFLVAVVAVSASDSAVAAAVTLVATVAVLVVLPTAVETLTRGKSLGKAALGLRTVRDDAGPIAFRQAFVRALLAVVEIWILSGVPALVCALVTTRGKRVGDLVAGTYVVRERFRLPPVRPVPMPPELASWAHGADIAPLPSGLALAVRQLLDRAPTLDPGSRAALGGQLVQDVLRHVAPAPPPGHHPEAVLAAVIAERRARDEARLARDEALRQRLRGSQPRR
jgi:uncharacterized RDD family membrane protein YckC